MGKRIAIVILSALILSCAKVIDRNEITLPKEKTYAVIPFENYTDTPLAGYRIASIIEGVLRARGYRVADRVWKYSEKEPSKEELNKLLQKALKKANYVVMGSVNEFRYKTGIDGEPAVSISVYIVDSSTGKVVYGSSLSATGWAHESLGTVSQKLIRSLLQ